MDRMQRFSVNNFSFFKLLVIIVATLLLCNFQDCISSAQAESAIPFHVAFFSDSDCTVPFTGGYQTWQYWSMFGESQVSTTDTASCLHTNSSFGPLTAGQYSCAPPSDVGGGGLVNVQEFFNYTVCTSGGTPAQLYHIYFSSFGSCTFASYTNYTSGSPSHRTIFAIVYSCPKNAASQMLPSFQYASSMLLICISVALLSIFL